MTQPCEQKAEIEVMKSEMIGIKDSLNQISNQMSKFINFFIGFMSTILLGLLGATFYLGGHFEQVKDVKHDIEQISSDFYVVKEKVSSLEDVVFINGLYKDMLNDKK